MAESSEHVPQGGPGAIAYDPGQGMSEPVERSRMATKQAVVSNLNTKNAKGTKEAESC